MHIGLIDAAAARLAPVVRRTPLLSSPFLDQIAGRQVLVKAECLQHTGSFKFRGAWAAISALSDAAKARGVLAYSSGNHAQGIARAAQRHAVAATIIMPADAPALKVANTKAYGAEVVLYDRAAGESREALGTQLAQDRGLTLIKPYDEPEVIAGQGSTGLEIAQQAAEADVSNADVLVCCGGGGLASGIALALEARAPALRVRTVEPEGFDDMARSLAAGELHENTRATGSICDAILTPCPGALTFPILSRLAGPGIVVSDDEALRAMALAQIRLKITLEPGGAVALAAALFHPEAVAGEAVIAVATGGNADPALMQRALSQFGDNP
ncbi:MAG: threonine/serine dehydratase [Pseudomonadota bacterium]